MAEEKTRTQIDFILKDLSFKGRNRLVNGTCLIEDEQAFSIYSDFKTAEKIYEADKKSGLDVRFVGDMKAIVESFPGKSKDEITEIIKEQMKKLGAKEVETKKVN